MSVSVARDVLNPESKELAAVAAGATVALTFQSRVNAVKVSSSLGVSVRVKFGSATTDAAGSAVTSATQFAGFIPALGFIVFAVEQSATAIAITNTSALVPDLKITGYLCPVQ